MQEEKNTAEIQKALLKRALGYDTTEVVEEFAETDEVIKMTKRKVTSKNVPPDISAAKLLLDIYGTENSDLKNFSDEELMKEKSRLINLLKEKENEIKKDG